MMDIKLVTKAIAELDPNHDAHWISISYYDLENNWNDYAPSIASVKNKIAEYKVNELRDVRNVLLLETDWVSGTDVTESLKTKWNPYRQDLRDITNTYTSLEDVVWPTKPE
tara:strand:- start:42 stop:374 length:333 start_codon:yes stop_codon:yes gene_type:complete